jgi:hypothetical protein
MHIGSRLEPTTEHTEDTEHAAAADPGIAQGPLFHYAPNAEAALILRSEVPALWAARTILYVGAHPRSRAFSDEFATFADVTLLEPWLPNVGHYVARMGQPFRRVVHGVAMAVPWLLAGEPFGAAFWWHGPEHVAGPDLGPSLDALQYTTSLLVVGCPWGRYEQGAEYGNPFERHLSAIYPLDLVALGFTVRTIGAMDDPNGALVAWRMRTDGN